MPAHQPAGSDQLTHQNVLITVNGVHRLSIFEHVITMLGSKTLGTSRALLLAALVMAVGLAGCAGDSGGEQPAASCPTEKSDPAWGSYQEARDAAGEIYEPRDSDSPLRLKLLDPTDPQSVETGNLVVWVLLFDSEADEPVTDADFRIEAEMPAMGHGTSPETDPMHIENGIYKGCTNISMDGDWVINLEPQVSDGTVLEYEVEASTGGGS